MPKPKNLSTLWGMIHVPALPGSYKNNLSFKKIVDFSLKDAKALFDNGITHMFIENFWDVPFPKSSSKPHVNAAISIIADRIKLKYPNVTLGINILRNDALTALGVATITNSKVIRVNVLTHGRVTDQGILEGCAYDLKTYSVQLNSSVEIWADVEVKHSVPITQIPIEDSINDLLERGGADKIIFSGSRTGVPADEKEISRLINNQILSLEQIVIGSGVTYENLPDYLDLAKNIIVGSSLKLEDQIQNNIDPDKVTKLVSCL